MGSTGHRRNKRFQPKDREIFILDVSSGKRIYNLICVMDKSGNDGGDMRSMACQALIDGISTVWCRAHSREELMRDLRAIAETVILTRVHRRCPACPDIAGSKFFMN